MAESRLRGLAGLRSSVRRWRGSGDGNQRRHRSSPKPDPGPGDPRGRDRAPIVVDYRPESDGDPDPGEVVWAWIPFQEDPEQGKDRPVIVIGRVDGRFAAVALSSRGSDRHGERIPIGSGDWDSKRRESYAKLDRIFAFRAEQARREGAALARDRFDDVVTALSGLPGWPQLAVEVVEHGPPG